MPRCLAYPEVLRIDENPDFFYPGEARSLADHLEKLAEGRLWDADRGRRLAAPYFWEDLVPRLDDGIERVAAR